jgi:hypothetical protein
MSIASAATLEQSIVGMVGGYPALLVRNLVRGLKNYLDWDLETVQGI